VCADDEERLAIAHTLNADRRQLTDDQRQAVAIALREAGHSLRAIAGALGVSHETVRQDVSGVNDLTPERVAGADGKSYPSRRTTVLARSDREQERAQAALGVISDIAPDRTVHLKDAERIAREHTRDTSVPPMRTGPEGVDIRAGDFRDVLADVPDGSVDLILTDPPYPAEYLPLWSGLGEFAARVLRPGGSLLAMSGHLYLPDVFSRLSEHLTYHWTLAYLTPGGQAVQVFPRKVNTFWKPVVWYTRPPYEGRWIGDVARSDVNDNDKRFHGWGQSESGMYDLLSRIAEPGDTVCDPFMGGGTTAVVAAAYGCKVIGAELEPKTLARAMARLP
jgi:site-specific DNA-methyltransferase (adenine-specific)